ncbi:MAG: energy transducer TonB [Acidobacteria bacterium]|nr:energy transducer TonB [Acidobacteriota bacterium]
MPKSKKSSHLSLFGLFVLLAGTLTWADSRFAYTDTFRIYTIEMKSRNIAILNVINLTDNLQILEPANILMIKTNGEAVPGQVFAERNARGDLVYSAVRMVEGRSFMGVDLLGAFQVDGDIIKVYISQGGRFYDLEALDRPDFESLFTRLGQLDLTDSNVPKMFKRLEIPDLGTFIPFEESDSIDALFTDCLTPDGVNPPRILLRPKPELTPAAREAGFRGLVEFGVRVNEYGTVMDVTFVAPPPYGMTDRIRETVRNAWQFLPATYNGEVVATEINVTLKYGE